MNHNRCPKSNKPKPPPGFKYVSTEVLVPVPKPEPKPKVVKTTYVTNIVYQGGPGSSGHHQRPGHCQAPPPYTPRPHYHLPKNPPACVTKPSTILGSAGNGPVMRGLSWELVTPQSASQRLSSKAVVGGYEGWDGSPLWVIRSRQGNDLVPGKLAVKHNVAYVPFGGREVSVQNIEVLCAPPGILHWVPAMNGAVPPRAIPGGNTGTGEVLFIGRASHNNALTPGKVHTSHGCLYISFGGKEVAIKSYEVLCRVR